MSLIPCWLWEGSLPWFEKPCIPPHLNLSVSNNVEVRRVFDCMTGSRILQKESSVSTVNNARLYGMRGYRRLPKLRGRLILQFYYTPMWGGMIYAEIYVQFNKVPLQPWHSSGNEKKLTFEAHALSGWRVSFNIKTPGSNQNLNKSAKEGKEFFFVFLA